jgi:hypothetical protein
MAVDQLRGIAATLQIVVGFDIVQVPVWDKKSDHWDGQDGERRVVDPFRS